MVLSDGGVYDNMGDQWAIGLAQRKRRWAEAATDCEDAAELVVVNASAGMGWGSVKRIGVPLLGELFALLRVINVLHDNTTAPRRRMLIDQFDTAAKLGEGLRGALVTIEQSPFRIPDYFSKHSGKWADRAKRAEAVIEKLGGDNRDKWKEIAAENASVKTTLRRLGQSASARLLYHAYVLAMANLHVILGYPLLDVPSVDRFTEFVG
jgi:hypothetical protein